MQCTETGCTRAMSTRQLCGLHYREARAIGRIKPRFEHDPIDRFFRMVQMDEESGCWLWMGSRNRSGYGRSEIGLRQTAAHRWVYEELVGTIPDGFWIDHLCRVRNCVNPDHLEAVTPQENLLRGETVTAKNKAKTACPAGHPYAGENLMLDKNGWRRCRICRTGR